MNRRLLSNACLLVASLLLADQVLYKGLLVPQLARFHAVPFLWWCFVVSPIMIAAIVVVVTARSFRALMANAVAAASLTVLYEVATAYLQESGRVKAVKTLGPAALIMSLGWIVGLAALWLITWPARKARQGA